MNKRILLIFFILIILISFIFLYIRLNSLEYKKSEGDKVVKAGTYNLANNSGETLCHSNMNRCYENGYNFNGYTIYNDNIYPEELEFNENEKQGISNEEKIILSNGEYKISKSLEGTYLIDTDSPTDEVLFNYYGKGSNAGTGYGAFPFELELKEGDRITIDGVDPNLKDKYISTQVEVSFELI